MIGYHRNSDGEWIVWLVNRTPYIKHLDSGRVCRIDLPGLTVKTMMDTLPLLVKECI